MSAILVLILEKVLFPLALKILNKTGVISDFEESGIKAGTHVLQAVESIKTYPDYTGLGDK